MNSNIADRISKAAEEWADKEFPEGILAPENEELADAAYEAFIAGALYAESLGTGTGS